MEERKTVIIYSSAAQKLFEKAIEYKLLYLGRALQLAIGDYSGVKRKNGQDEVDHAIAVAWALWNNGIRGDEILAVAMMHDLVESAKETSQFICEWFNGEIADDVDYMTRRPEEKGEIDDGKLDQVFGFICQYYHEMKTDWSFRKFLTKNRQTVLEMLPDQYKIPVGGLYDRLAKSANRIVIKSFDKIDVFRNMGSTLPFRNCKLQILEYEAFLAPACKNVRKTNPEYREALFSGRNQIETLIDNVINEIKQEERLIKACKEVKRLELEIANLVKRLERYEK